MSKALRGLTALIVEDNQGGSTLMAMILRRLGINVYTNDTGEGIPELLDIMPESPHFIFLDLNLPRRTGFEILKSLREIPELFDTKIVAITASDPYEMIPKCQEAGFDSFILKPIRREKFVDIVTRIHAGEIIWDNLY